MLMNPQTQTGENGNPIQYVGLPPALTSSITETKHYFQALDNFF